MTSEKELGGKVDGRVAKFRLGNGIRERKY